MNINVAFNPELMQLVLALHAGFFFVGFLGALLVWLGTIFKEGNKTLGDVDINEFFTNGFWMIVLLEISISFWYAAKFVGENLPRG